MIIGDYMKAGFEMKLSDEKALMRLQFEIGESGGIRTKRKASRPATGLTEFQLPSVCCW